MGTRADFYVGKGKDAKWIGSVAWDGYAWGERLKDSNPDDIINAKTEQEYRAEVTKMLASRDDGTIPEMGWPWPWDDSCTTDCSYCFVDGKFEAFSWGRAWDDEDEDKLDWPDMKGQDHAAPAGSSRSGVILVSGI